MATPRLLLRPMAPDDVDDLVALLGDARLWTYDPERRHADRAQTAAYVARAAERWGSDGLSYWTVRLRSSGAVVGSGGVQRHGTFWNLNYRIAADHQGAGLAGELLHAALDAAHEVDASLPRIAWIDATNQVSVRVAGRAGLSDEGLRLGSSDGVARHALADRTLDDVTYPRVGSAR